MTTTYVNVNFVFDKSAWAEMLRALPPDERDAARQLSEMTESGWSNWLNPSGRKYPYPNMSNFLLVCNLLEVDPRRFFTAE